MTFDLYATLSYSIFDNTIQDYLIALAVLIVGSAILWIFKNIVLARIRKFAEKTETDYDDLLVDIIAGIGWPFYTYIALYFAIHFLTVPNIVIKISHYVLAGVIILYILTSIMIVINFAKKKILESKKKSEKEADPTIINVLASIVKVLVWVIAALLILQNLGYNVTSIVAGLGVLGIAVAFALQNILSDIFASFSIYFDKPFVVGDKINIGNDTGTVEKIGIKSTRIKTIQGHELIVSNKELTTVRVNNYKGMQSRRVLFTVGVAYETQATILREIPSIISKIITEIKDTKLDRVHLSKMADSSLNYEVVYFVTTGDYTRYMDIQQEINLKILEEFEKRKISIAYPTQKLYISKD